ncbi:membrane protein [Flavobacterium noncentrifugens]|uniref:Chaperone for outer membrane proteins, Skp family n=1 Tax=Flavobacterium noncentrifugens TaxID=1128970 RepID=A0A1G8RUA5_9FLAO|nr:OmpH family outer membrane protein [Flavobacterium noncentrifugens]GEP49583.1 membrane protein [Flavobacterium noncentrifugens]SDJ20542.1 chaperone for outer membrane proteins, Skp family [Flavobacterium noncentrifugens]
MRKHFLLLLIVTAVCFTAKGQSARGVKIGYIDMEYILQNVPDYTEAKNQLEQKAQKWKQEVELKKNEVTKLKDALKTERVLLTKELIAEREEEIVFQETALLDYQQKRFGPTGDLSTQKTVLTQPIQDQVFNAVQDIAEAKKYDFIFDKTSDLTMLFSAKRYDISDQVIRAITRSSKRQQLSKKQLKEEDAKEAKEDMVDESPALQERQKKIDDRKAAREKLVADRKAAQEAKRAEMLAAREAKKNGTTVPVKEVASKATDSTSTTTSNKKTTVPATETAAATSDSTATTTTTVDKRTKTAEERAKIIADRKKAAEEKRQKILADREAAKKEKEDKKKETKPQD